MTDAERQEVMGTRRRGKDGYLDDTGPTEGDGYLDDTGPSEVDTE